MNNKRKVTYLIQAIQRRMMIMMRMKMTMMRMTIADNKLDLNKKTILNVTLSSTNTIFYSLCTYHNRYHVAIR